MPKSKKSGSASKRKLSSLKAEEVKTSVDDFEEESVSATTAPQKKRQKTSDGTAETSDSRKKTLEPLAVSPKSWRSLELTKKTLMAVEKQGFDEMLEVQWKSLPFLLNGRNLVGAAKTGSGKTLAFLIPVIEKLAKRGWNPSDDGIGALILAPTRELAMQIRKEAIKLVQFHSGLTVGLLIGGNPKRSDVSILTSGVSICVGTPGRVLDHLMNTPQMVVERLCALVLDEADRMLDEGYAEEVDAILKALPRKRQTILFSATQTKKSADLIRLCFDSKPECVFVDEKAAASTRSTLEQGYMVSPTEQKFLLLFSMLKRLLKNGKKVVVFLSTVAATKFFVELLQYIDLKEVYGLFGSLSQKKRTQTFFEFMDATSGVLLATNVAARGLDIPNVDWIIQFDPPSDVRDYVHRVGRTCRGAEEKAKGRALQILVPDEIKFLQVLGRAKVGTLKEYEFPHKKVAQIQKQLEKITSSVYHLHVLAHEAYMAYMREYALRSTKTFDVLTLDIVKVANCFALAAPPRVTVESFRKKKSKQADGSVVTESRYKTVPLRLKTNNWAKTKQRSGFKFKSKQ